MLAANGNNDFISTDFKICINADKGNKTVVKKTSGLRSLERSSSKNMSSLRHNNRNYVPTTSGVIVDVLRKSQKDVSLRMGANGFIDL